MANKKISELQSRTPALSDLMLVGDPSSGYSYKCTITALATIIETDIADGYVTIGTNQTISGAKTFSNNLTLTSVPSSAIDTDKFLVLNSNVVNYRTGAEVLSDIGGQGALTLTTTGTSGAATLVGNTLNIPQYQSVLTNPVTGTGTTNYVTKWTSSSAVGNSQIIDNGTAIGIGTAPSNAYLLSVAGIYRGIATGDGARIELIDSQSGGATFFVSPQQSLGVTSLGTYGAYPISFVTNNTERARLLSGGNFGINTTTPNEKLEVSGVVRVSRTTSASAYLNLTIESGVAGFDARGSIDQVFYTNTLERVRIGFGGEVTLSSIANATTDTDKFLVSDSGVIKYRTGSEVLSDIGGASSSSISGTTNYIPKFTSSSAIGNSTMQTDGTNFMVGSANAGNAGAINVSVGVAGTTAGGIQLWAATNQTHYLQFGDGTTGSDTYRGFVGYEHSADALIFGTATSERLRISSTGNVGIGTSLPSDKLEVNGAIFTTSNTVLSTTKGAIFDFNDGQDAGRILTYKSTGSNLLFYTNPNGGGLTLRATLDASGNLGLGVTPSAWASGIQAIDISSGGAGIFGASNYAGFTANAFINTSGVDTYKANDFATKYLQISGTHRWYNAPSGTAGNAISFTQAMTLDASGNLGIGSTSPSTPLAGAKGLVINSGATGDAQFRLQNNNTGSASSDGALLSLASDNSMYLYNYENAAINFGTNNSIRATITSAGNVGIGTTSPTFADGLGLNIYNSVGSVRLKLNNNTTGSASTDGVEFTLAGSDLYIINNEAANTLFFNNGSERMRITSGGELLINTTTDAGDYKLQVNGNSYVNGQQEATSFYTNDTRYISNQIQSGYNTNSEDSDIWINYTGYQGGTTRFRDFRVGDGKQNQIAFFDGSTKNAEFGGSIKTAAPSGGTAAAWKLGERVASSSLTLNTTQYIQVDIAGTLYTLATVNLS